MSLPLAPGAPRARLAATLALSAFAYLTVAASRLEAQGVVINEIHYDAPDNTRREEFIELHNPGASSVDATGWFFSSGVDFTFPAGTAIASGGYLVIAEDPVDFEARFGSPPDLGPYGGRLSSDGERLTLREPDGDLVDSVNWAARFPWPIAAAGEGSSMELIHPSLDNGLGGSWRASGNAGGAPVPTVFLVPSGSPGWRWRKGTSEPSAPVSAWRKPGFREDATWQDGRAPIGYGDGDDATTVGDMRGNYTSLYLRKSFPVDDPAALDGFLRLRVYIDDGCVVWLNGNEVGRFFVSGGALAHDATAQNHEASWEEIDIGAPASWILPGENVLAIHALNQALTSSDLSVDASLLLPGSEEGGLGPPTPGRRNSVWAENAPPQVRQVQTAPPRPASGRPFVVMAKVTDPDAVDAVSLRWQAVPPGGYIPAYLPLPHGVLLSDASRPRDRNPAFDDPAAWTSAAMVDDGTGADTLAGDSIWTAVVPAQANRTLFRYRIVARDGLGLEVETPYLDDPSLNFAAFVYDGVPEYRTTARSIHAEGAGHVWPREVMSSLPVYFLIARSQDVVECVAASGSLQIPQGTQARFAENWEGAFVYEDEVYDHVDFRLRGANGRYQVPPGSPAGVSGKRHWKFKFKKGHYLQTRDRFGRKYPTRWRVLNTGRMFGNRLDGNWGLGDQVNDVIWTAWDIPAPAGHVFHFRVIDGPEEAPGGTNGQYLGDFWGIARAFENYDVRFLEAHDLPKGNLYKLVNQTKSGLEQQRYQAPNAVSDGSDHDNIENRLRASQSDAWLLAHVDYDAWYRYHAVAEAIRHYDYWPSANKNATWYFQPTYTPENSFLGRMMTLPFDTDATWGPTWNEGKDRPWDAIYASPGKPGFQRRYRNALREVRDLLWQRDQLEVVIRQTASFMDALEEPDIDRWRLAPAEAGRQYFSGSSERSVFGKAQDMIRFAFVGGNWPGGSVGTGGRARFLDQLPDGPDSGRLPARPTVEYTGAAGFPVDGLQFRASPFSDPQGANTFRVMEWRLAEVAPIDSPTSISISDPLWRAAPLPLELHAIWKSGELARFDPDLRLSSGAVGIGKRYRVRVRMEDTSGLWSHWSLPVEFTTTGPSVPLPAVRDLRITEIMYHPSGGNDFEFVEILNTGAAAIDLQDVSFRDGIEFSFAGSDIPVLLPGEYAVAVSNRKAFEAKFPAAAARIAGDYAGQLSDGGERVTLVYGDGIVIQDLEYDDLWYPETDGLGASLEVVDPLGPLVAWSRPDGWMPSAEPGGTPGLPPSGEPPSGGLRRVGDANGDAAIDLSDAAAILRLLFVSGAVELPCDGATANEGGSAILLDANGDGSVDISDAIHILQWLFKSGAPPTRGIGCIRIDGCTTRCGA